MKFILLQIWRKRKVSALHTSTSSSSFIDFQAEKKRTQLTRSCVQKYLFSIIEIEKENFSVYKKFTFFLLSRGWFFSAFPGIRNRTFFSIPFRLQKRDKHRQHKSKYFIETHHASQVVRRMVSTMYTLLVQINVITNVSMLHVLFIFDKEMMWVKVCKKKKGSPLRKSLPSHLW